MSNPVDNEKLSGQALRDAWIKIVEEKPRTYPRDAANQLGVSEAELIASKIGDNVTRLEGDWDVFVKRLPALKQVLSITRNETCVLEHKGNFQKVETFGSGPHHMGQVIGPIETRLFLANWFVAFHVINPKAKGFMESIQIFDKSGDAVTKIYLKEKGDREAFEQLVADYTSENQSKKQAVTAPAEKPHTPKEEVDGEALRKDWSELKDTHDFFGMIRKHKAHRYDALELAGEQFAYRVKIDSLQPLLEKVAADQFPIMIFAGNRGNIQIHQGKVKNIKPMGDWLNIMDPNFNMHLRTSLVHDAWVVKKPTTDGEVTSIELFDKDKELVTQFFGLRKPGIPEREQWREYVSQLEKN
ncbi:hemin-degrading factor [Fulvitalea axinellae]|uniref:Hemin-degrading factor n=1 Tax=Fulvitalea axinellae TaxID=1182444 RepID=A0AAU9CXS3_9BACT|nr:hemin-degrading factor [Fulvitalea axinellae]